MEENKEKNKVSLVLVILIGLVVAGAFGYACYEIGKKETNKENKQIEENQKEEEKNPVEENNIEEQLEDDELTDMTRIFNVITRATIEQDDLHEKYSILDVEQQQLVECQVDSDGYLNSVCLPKELENKKIIDVSYLIYDFGGDLVVLSEDGIIYHIYDTKTVKNISSELKISEKVTDIGNVVATCDCDGYGILTYTTSKGTYTEDGEKVEDIMLGIVASCNRGDTDLNDIEIYYDGTLSLDDKFIKDQDTNEKVVVDYLVLQVKNNEEKLYLVGRNKKLYILDKFEEKVKVYSDVVNINYDDTSENERINIKLANGESFEFVNNY